MVEAKTSLGSGLIPPDPKRTRYTLPTGEVVDVLEGKGKHLRIANRLVSERERGDHVALSFALASVLCRVDGRDLAYEDIDELPINVAAELVAVMQGQRLSDEQRQVRAERGEKEAAVPKGDSTSSQPST